MTDCDELPRADSLSTVVICIFFALSAILFWDANDDGAIDVMSFACQRVLASYFSLVSLFSAILH